MKSDSERCTGSLLCSRSSRDGFVQITYRDMLSVAPSILGLKPSGVETLPNTLLANGLAEQLKARRAARVETPPYRADRDPVTLTLNDRAINRYSTRLADAIGALLDNGEFPIVLGGDCSILLGSMLALRRRGHSGLLFIDGHADFYQPEANPNGEASGGEFVHPAQSIALTARA